MDARRLRDQWTAAADPPGRRTQCRQMPGLPQGWPRTAPPPTARWAAAPPGRTATASCLATHVESQLHPGPEAAAGTACPFWGPARPWGVRRPVGAAGTWALSPCPHSSRPGRPHSVKSPEAFAPGDVPGLSPCQPRAGREPHTHQRPRTCTEHRRFFPTGVRALGPLRTPRARAGLHTASHQGPEASGPSAGDADSRGLTLPTLPW